MKKLLLLIIIAIASPYGANADVPICEGVSLVESYSFPEHSVLGQSYNLNGLAFNGKSIWAAGWGDGAVYELSFNSVDNSSTIVKTFLTPTPQPTGLTFRGSKLFISTDYRFDSDTPLVISSIKTRGKVAGTVSASFAPGIDSTGLTFANDSFYNADFHTADGGGKIHQLTADGQLIQTYTYPENLIGSPTGLDFDGTNLWVGEWQQNKVYKLDISTMEPICFFDGPVPDNTEFWPNGGFGPVGIAYVEGYLWLTEQRDFQIHKIDVGP